MSCSDNSEMFQCNFDITEHYKKLYELAKRYCTECEAYDRTVCTGPIDNGAIMPATQREVLLISSNARIVRKRIEDEACQHGFTRHELSREIRRYAR